jgi:hypothetical protein
MHSTVDTSHGAKQRFQNSSFRGLGGAIEVTVNNNRDSENLQAIRSHLTHIVTMLSAGEFSLPMFIHDQVPVVASIAPGGSLRSTADFGMSWTVLGISDSLTLYTHESLRAFTL